MKRIVLSIFALLLTTFAWGQALSGSGTESNPYQITSADDWNVFATEANAATYWASGKCVRLDADITVSAMVGTSTNKYSGTFDGNWHTLTFNNGSVDNPCLVEKCAPFSYAAPGLMIKNLMVEGTIVSQKKYAAGLIGWVEGSGTYHITNCTSNITIDCSKIEKGTNNKQYDCSTGGFIGQIESGNVYFENCIFDGLIDKGAQSSANRCAGFVSYINSGHIYYTNCAMAGSITLTSYRSTFNRNNKNTFREAYYINDYGDVTNCTQATTTEPTTEVAKKYLRNGNNYFVPKAIVTGLETTTYSYIEGQPVTITPVVTYCGNSMARGTDYIIKIDGTEVPTEDTPTLNAAGDYTFTIEGKTGSSYAGSQTTTIHVVSLNYNTWAALQERLAEASQDVKIITLSGDITPTLDTDVALEVNGTVVLNLNGKTIDRGLTEAIVKGQVIRVNNGANLTINGPGIIQGGYNKAENDTEHGIFNDGGGIYNMGTLVLNNVIVTNNTCVKMTENSTARTARGGGIYTGSGSSFTMTGGSISSNEGKGGGGGIHCDNAAVFDMDNVTIDWNICESKGAGVRVNTSNDHTANLRGCEVTGNFLTSDSESKGGGIYLGGGDLFMENCIICGNSSNRQGAGFFSMNGTTTAKNCEIYWNGTNFPSDDNLGGGICLYDNTSQGNHSVYIMDGGSVYENNSIADGGGIFVYDGAVFQVKGNVQISNNYKASVETGGSDNNTYLQGSSIIEVVGTLAEDAYIVITPHGDGGTYVTFAEGVSTTDALSHFALDDDEYRLILVGNQIEAYELYPWNVASTWNGTIATNLNGQLPTVSNSVTINRGIKIPSGCVAEADAIILGEYGEIVIKDGGQLYHNNESVIATVQKTIAARNTVDNVNKGWAFIASPVATNVSPNSVSNMTGTAFDLYRFNQNANLEWENYLVHNTTDDPFLLENGQGYLYNNESTITLGFTGAINPSNIPVSVSIDSIAGAEFAGWNLVGNPFTFNAFVDRPYYMMNEDGSAILATEQTSGTIAPCTGIMVHVGETDQSVTFSKEPLFTSPSNGNVSIAVVQANERGASSTTLDKAIVSFNKGSELPKFYFGNTNAKLYIPQGNKEFAIACAETQGEIPLNFRANENGQYALTINAEGVDLAYLHLIDNMTGADVDLLQTPSYSFEAKTTDYANRFKLVFVCGDANDDNETFAFINNGNIIITADVEGATLQVIDMMGRIIHQGNATDCTSTSELVSGVYVLRLIQNSDAKTQKIVVD